MLCQRCSRPVGQQDIFCGECGALIERALTTEPTSTEPTSTKHLPTIQVDRINQQEQLDRDVTVHLPTQEPELIEPVTDVITEDLEVTRLLGRSRFSGPKFELQFSTGGSFTVSGSGLLGRNPKPEESEPIEQLVYFRDPHRTVSKTHLAFGVDGKNFWVNDRNSVNGTYRILGADLSNVQECEPGTRYLIPDGGTVGIGDEYFQVTYL